MLAAAVDGFQIKSNMMMVMDPQEVVSPTALSVDVSPSGPPDTIMEKFYADTGANRSIHSNQRAASSFYRVALNISTASTGNSMVSEGVGKLDLLTPDGIPFPGFDRVVFSKQRLKNWPLWGSYVMLAWYMFLTNMG